MRFKNAVGQNMPSIQRLPKGTYYWCQCGETGSVPFCDGSHEGSGILPLEFTSEGPSAKTVCNCGLTEKPPECDGKHQNYR